MSLKPHHEADPAAVEWQTNKKEFVVRPRGLNIVWGNDPRYWRLTEATNDKEAAAELVQVSWFEVTGSANLEHGKKYEISFRVSLKPDAFGWKSCPVYLMAKIGKKGKYLWKKMDPLDQIRSFPTGIPDKFSIEVPKEGERQLFFGLYEVWSGKWKGGLVIHHAIIKQVD